MSRMIGWAGAGAGVVIGAVLGVLLVNHSTAASPSPARDADVEFVLRATLVQVTDGDTLEVRLDSGVERVRLYGIDAPEGRAPGGREATAALKVLVRRGTLEVQPVSDDPRDRYDRLIAVLYADGINVNEQLLDDGHAWAYRQFLGQVKGDRHYCELEAEARTAHRGLWAQPAERWVPPWIYRARQKAAAGARVPSPDYSSETAADCVAAIGKTTRMQAVSTPPARVSQKTVDGVDGRHPAGCDIKGNINSKGVKIYHLPGTASYAATRINTAQGERWFCSEQEAQAAGWRAPR